MKRVALLLCGSLVLARLAALGMDPIHLGSPYMEGWVPDDRTVLRGVLVLDGWPMDGRWDEACRAWSFAIVRINSDGYEEQLPDGDPLARGALGRAKALRHGIRLLAERTGHPELLHAPLVTSGYSRFSGPAVKYLDHFPGRVICFLTGFGPSGAELNENITENAHAWLQTPSQWLGCEWENIYNAGDKRTILKQWQRAPGVLRMASMTWRVYHNPDNFHDLGMIFIERCIRARVPVDWDPLVGPPTLHAVHEADGWLGSHAGWAIPVEEIPDTWNEHATIAPFAAFEGPRQDASWLLDEEVAVAWRAFCSRDPKVRIVAPGHPNIAIHEAQPFPPLLHTEQGIRLDEEFPVTVRCDEDGIAAVTLFLGTRELVTGTAFSGGASALGSTKGAECTLPVTVTEPGVHALMARYTMRDGRVGWSRLVPVIPDAP